MTNYLKTVRDALGDANYTYLGGDYTVCMKPSQFDMICATLDRMIAGPSGDVAAGLDALINTNCQEDTKFLRTKIIDYSDYPNEGCEHLENMCIIINKMRKKLIEYRALAQSGGAGDNEPLFGYEICGNNFFAGTMKNNGGKVDDIWWLTDITDYSDEALQRQIKRVQFINLAMNTSAHPPQPEAAKVALDMPNRPDIRNDDICNEYFVWALMNYDAIKIALEKNR